MKSMIFLKVMRGYPSKPAAPITVRITADVKPKPVVAEIQVGRSCLHVLGNITAP